MPDDEEDIPAEGAEGESTSKKKKIIIFAALAILLIGLSVGGTMATLALLKKDEPVPELAEGEGEGEDVSEKKLEAIYYPLKPSYVVNVDARGRRRYLQADLTLLIRDPSMTASIDTHKPSIDNVVNSELGGIVFEDIKTAEGKELLRLQLTQAMQALFQEEVDDPVVEMVLFTNFVMQ